MSTTYFQTFVDAIKNLPDKQVLGQEWVIFPPSPDYGYDSTPRNALTFAVMGVDRVHYAILTFDGAVRDDSPVIQICPMDFSDLYGVLAESFLSYLAQGCGVSIAKMEAVFAKERNGKQTLAPLLKERFDQSRLWREERSPDLDRFLDLIEPKARGA